MSYVVSARRWRPQTFEDLIGQEHVSRTLANAIRADRVAHAFLFTGVRGVGKTTAARVLAKALNCEKGLSPTPCNACTNCKEITAGNAVDVLEIDGASNTGVDDVREIIQNVRYQAAKSRFKIYIIDEVHMLSNSAFNALLKTLEEPPEHVKFIFATTDPHKLPATVQSRCQRYDFRRIPLAQVVGRLKQICEADGVELGDRALFMLAREGEGSMRDAQSLLDQVMAGASGQISDEVVLQTLGIADRQVIHDIGDAIIGRDGARALELLGDVYRLGYDLRRLARDLVEHFRDIAVAKVSDGRLLPDLAEEEAVALRSQAGRIGSEECDRAFQILRETDEEVGRSPYPKLLLEMALIKLATLPPLLPVDEMLQRIEEMESNLSAAGGVNRARPSSSAQPARTRTEKAVANAPREEPAHPTVVEAEKNSPEPPVAQAASGPGAVGGQGWDEFLAFVKHEKRALGTHLGTCRLVAMGGKGLEIEASNNFRHTYLSRSDHLKEIEECAGRFFGRKLRVKVAMPTADQVVAGADSGAKKAKPSSAERAEAALGNPIVQAAVDILGGEVAEVRERRSGRREE